MPKLKTHRGAAKRFSKTGTGKVRRNNSMKRHILTKKSTSRKRRLRHAVIASDPDSVVISRMIPYK
jgi:large subunit ribosomal protein L35